MRAVYILSLLSYYAPVLMLHVNKVVCALCVYLLHGGWPDYYRMLTLAVTLYVAVADCSYYIQCTVAVGLRTYIVRVLDSAAGAAAL